MILALGRGIEKWKSHFSSLFYFSMNMQFIIHDKSDPIHESWCSETNYDTVFLEPVHFFFQVHESLMMKSWKNSFKLKLLLHLIPDCDFTHHVLFHFCYLQMWLPNWLNWTPLWRNTKLKRLNANCSSLAKLPKSTVLKKMVLWLRLSTKSSGMR